MGKHLASRKVKPDLIISSPALRAVTTAELIAREIGYEQNDIVIDDRLYAASQDNLLSVVRELDKKVDCVMLCGHNPEFTDLARRLSDEISDMPTCAVAEFRYDTKTWEDVGDVNPSKVKLDVPEE
jgi:phosphohistidine phosphatase